MSNCCGKDNVFAVVGTGSDKCMCRGFLVFSWFRAFCLLRIIIVAVRAKFHRTKGSVMHIFLATVRAPWLLVARVGRMVLFEAFEASRSKLRQSCITCRILAAVFAPMIKFVTEMTSRFWLGTGRTMVRTVRLRLVSSRPIVAAMIALVSIWEWFSQIRRFIKTLFFFDCLFHGGIFRVANSMGNVDVIA